MAFYLILLLTVLNHVSFKGSKVLISLFAIDLGANPLTIGVLFAMYSVFPVFLSVYAGKISDRFGFRPPMILGSCGLLAGLLLPYFSPDLVSLFFSATLIGMFYIFYVVAVQHLIGSFGEGLARTRNYSIFSGRRSTRRSRCWCRSSSGRSARRSACFPCSGSTR